MMDKCSKCGAETELRENGNPICVKCSEEIESARKRTAAEATTQYRESPAEAVLARRKAAG
jgi:hypothetical protein